MSAWTQDHTHWSMLLLSNEGGWRYFYERYRDAVEALFRREGLSASDADDVTQEFFLRTLNQDFLHRADPERGRFRAYLRTAARRFLAKHRRAEARLKRRPAGGHVELNDEIELGAPGLSPDEAFDLAWAKAVLARGVERARSYLQERGRAQQLRALLLRQEGASWASVAEELGTSAGAARQWGGRAEKVVARFVAEEVSGTVAGEGELGEELRELSRILAQESP